MKLLEKNKRAVSSSLLSKISSRVRDSIMVRGSGRDWLERGRHITYIWHELEEGHPACRLLSFPFLSYQVLCYRPLPARCQAMSPCLQVAQRACHIICSALMQLMQDSVAPDYLAAESWQSMLDQINSRTSNDSLKTGKYTSILALMNKVKRAVVWEGLYVCSLRSHHHM